MRLAWGSDIAVEVAEGKADVVAQGSIHAGDSMAEEAHSRQGRPDMLEVRRSGVRD